MQNLIFAALATVACVTAHGQHSKSGWIIEADFDVDSEWEHFVSHFGKQHYKRNAELEAEKKAIFSTSLKRAAARNAAQVAAGGAHVFGVTKFSDQTQEQFDAANKGRKGMAHTPTSDVRVTAPPADKSVPDAFDWTGVATTAVKNQGQCGSCWAHSAVEQIESQYMLAGNSEWPLSVQQVNSCTASTFGCGGGDTTAAYEQLISGATKTGISTAGVASAAMVPYEQSMTSECLGPVCTVGCSDLGEGVHKVGDLSDMVKDESLTGPYVSISGYSYATPSCTGPCASQDLTTLQANIAGTAPASVCVNAASWNDYVGGVMTSAACGSMAFNELDHCVQLVGYDMSGDSPYWIVRNSWATNWGEEGHIWLQGDANTCGLADEATFVDIVSRDHDRRHGEL